MIKKDDLKQYNDMKALLSLLDEEINQAYNTYKSPQMQARIMDYDQSDPGDPVTRALKKNDRLKNERSKLAAEIKAIEQYVDNIDDYSVRGIVRYHFLERNTWEATCIKFRGHRSLSVVVNKVNNYFASEESMHD